MTEIELAWAAGLFEGEGSIRISKPALRNWGSLNVSVPNTDRQIVEFFADRWLGSVAFTESVGRRRGFWRWTSAALKAAVFLRDIRPFVRTERVLAKLDHGLAFQAQKVLGRGPDNHGEAYREDQWNFYWWMAELNQRGVLDHERARR